jgi:hypothetical protein
MNITWLGLSFCGALIYVSASASDNRDNPRRGMEKLGGISPEHYAWGSECADGLSIGLFIAGREFPPNTTIRWRWAIRNNRDSVREVTVRHSEDAVFRYRLSVSRPERQEPLWEFGPPVLRETVGGLGKRIIVLRDHPVELEGGEASIDSAWGSGIYRFQLIFGGPAFRFECRSGIIDVFISEGKRAQVGISSKEFIA